MTSATQHAAYRRAGFARHGISFTQAQSSPTFRAILRCAELAEARRQARGQAALAREHHHKGAEAPDLPHAAHLHGQPQPEGPAFTHGAQPAATTTSAAARRHP